jgi:hypothetical protein
VSRRLARYVVILAVLAVGSVALWVRIGISYPGDASRLALSGFVLVLSGFFEALFFSADWWITGLALVLSLRLVHRDARAA